MQMVAAGTMPVSQGGYTLPPTAAYFPMATYTTIQQQQSSNVNPSIQQPPQHQQIINVQSSQMQINATVSSSNVGLPSSATLNTADALATSTSKATEGTPAVTQPNTPDLLIHRRQV